MKIIYNLHHAPVIKVYAEGRFSLPPTVIKKLGMKAGEKVLFGSEHGFLYICKAPPNTFGFKITRSGANKNTYSTQCMRALEFVEAGKSYLLAEQPIIVRKIHWYQLVELEE